ncbi:MAG TPA: NADH-quinone oxidoreductase subunit J [Actinomycetota bacterium]|jgi:NADH-quinone oxidoreductase subunit J|nr:NADH-quinone oxidoreductase subunit J [Actinomycetota bacterium]
MPLDNVVFWVFAPISIGSAIGMLFQRNAVHAALFLIVNFFTIAVFFLILGAPFLFAVQIIVYAGAIMVLFLFVIMLLGVDREETLIEQLRGQRPLAIVLGLGIAVELFFAIRAGVGFATRGPENFDEVANRGLVRNAEALSRVLFRTYFFPFEVTSILLIIAAIAVMVLASRRARAITRAEQAAAVDRREREPVA